MFYSSVNVQREVSPSLQSSACPLTCTKAEGGKGFPFPIRLLGRLSSRDSRVSICSIMNTRRGENKHLISNLISPPLTN